MPKRKKHPRLPSGMGSIRYLGKGRTRPYAVHPPCKECDPITGEYIRPKALCYVSDWYIAFSVLSAYHAGTYKPGDEKNIEAPAPSKALDQFCQALIDNFSTAAAKQSVGGKTFAEVYEAYFDSKFGEKAPKKLSPQAKASSKAAFKLLSALHDRPIADLSIDEMQQVLNECPRASASLENMVSLIKQVFRYADARGYVNKDLGKHVVVPNAKEDEHGVPFTTEDIRRLWSDQEDPTAEFMLIMIYSGFRITAYRSMEINLEDGYFRGGVKTKAGKGRIVPIHPYIRPLVERRLDRDGHLLRNNDKYRIAMHRYLKDHGFEDHTPHDCRHTFSMLCEMSGVAENDRKRMLGHAFEDVTNAVYGHRSLDDLRKEIEKIRFM